MRIICLTAICLLLTCLTCLGQTNSWSNKKAAVVLTYDDAIPQHLYNAIPVLDSLHLKATFYITAFNAKAQINDWKKVALNGHELGNHTLFHPCIGGIKGREWVKSERNMNHYTVQQMLDEIRMTNVFLQALDGKTKRTFAYTCGDMTVNDTSFVDDIKKDFVAARGVHPGLLKIEQVNLFNINCFTANQTTATEMKQWIDQAINSGSLVVILFHGIGGGNPLNITVKDHSELLHYLKTKEKDIWIAPMLEVVNYIKKQQD